MNGRPVGTELGNVIAVDFSGQGRNDRVIAAERLREIAQQIVCPDCQAPPGKRCAVIGESGTRYTRIHGPHPNRIDKARKERPDDV